MGSGEGRTLGTYEEEDKTGGEKYCTYNKLLCGRVRFVMYMCSLVQFALPSAYVGTYACMLYEYTH